MYVISILRPDQKHTHEKYYTFFADFRFVNITSEMSRG